MKNGFTPKRPVKKRFVIADEVHSAKNTRLAVVLSYMRRAPIVDEPGTGRTAKRLIQEKIDIRGD